VSQGRDNLRWMVGAPPPSSSLRSRGDASLRAIDPSQPPSGGPGHLWLPAEHDEYSFYVMGGGGVSGIRKPDWWGSLWVPSARMRRLAANSSSSEASFNPDEPNLQLLVSSVPKASPPQVGVEASLGILLML
jgi:hypothetical protein